MRDYQAKSNIGALPDSNSATKLGAGEATSLRTEAKNSVSRAGLILAPQDGTGEVTTQLAQALFINGAGASHFQDGGAINAIALTPVTGAGGLILPPDYTTLAGAHFTFFAAFANTGAVTLSIGQTGGTQFGVKDVLREDGSALVADDIDTIIENEVVYDSGPDKFFLVRGAGLSTDVANNVAIYNIIINGGSPFVNQRGAQVSMAPTDYFVDRFFWNHRGTGVVNGDAVSGFIEIDVTTADVSLAADDFYTVGHVIEGFNTEHLALGTPDAETVTLSFSHKHTKTGTYCISIRNEGLNRSYIAEYNQVASNVEETSTVVVDLDTTGTWSTGNNIGLVITFTLATGSDLHAPSADTWHGADYIATANQVNALDNAANYFRITDIQLEIGSSATEFKQEDYGVTLAKCQRYFIEPDQMFGSATSASDMAVHYLMPVEMRAPPTVALKISNPTGESPPFAVGRSSTGATISIAQLHTKSVHVKVTGFNSMTANQPALLQPGAITIDAEI